MIFLIFLMLYGPGLLLLFAGCTKEPEYYYVEDEMKPWTFYKEGSWWVYLNDKTGTTDCTWVSRFSKTDHITGGNGSSDTERHYEVYGYSFEGKIFDYAEIQARERHPDVMYDGSQYSLHGISAQTVQLSYGWLNHPGFYKNNRDMELYNYGVKQVHPEETFNGIRYTNVYQLQTEAIDYFGDSLVTEAHLVVNKGIVKFRVYKEGIDTTWTLLRSNIVQ